MVVDRGDQYAVVDNTAPFAPPDPRYRPQWQGVGLRTPHLRMIGEVGGLGTNRSYQEWLYDRGQLVMHSYALCQSDTVAPAPVAAAPRDDDSVPIVTNGRGALVMVGLGSSQVPMLIDTGAEMLQLSDSVSEDLIARGEATPVYTADGRVAHETFSMADGHANSLRRLTVHTLTIGSHVLHEVPAAATLDDGSMLLPFTVLNRIGKFTIDTANHKLIFG
jgi:hypothetical protein